MPQPTFIMSFLSIPMNDPEYPGVAADDDHAGDEEGNHKKSSF